MITTLETTKIILGISDASKDALITLYIPKVEADYLNIRNKAFDLDTDGITIIYPSGSDITASQMIGYQIAVIEEDGRQLSSESDLSYSVSYNNTSTSISFGYPNSIIQSIERFSFIGGL